MREGDPMDECKVEAALERPGRMTRAERRWHLGSALALVLAAILVWLIETPERSLDWPTLTICVALMALASRVEFDLPRGLTAPLQTVLVPMLVLLPAHAVTPAVVAALALGQLPDVFRGRVPASRLSVAIPNGWFAVGPAAVFAVLGERADVALVLPIAVAVQIAVDFGVSAMRDRELGGTPLRDQLTDSMWVYAIDVLLTPLGLMAALACDGRPGRLVLLLGVFAILAFFARERRSRLEQLQELYRAYRGTALVLGDVIEADDAYTGEHGRGVVSLALEVGTAMGLDAAKLRNVEFGALLHDVGKVAIPNEIINKPGPLDDAEWALMRTHTVEGQRMLERIGGVMGEVGTIVRASHERWDGGGYPDGLVGEAIPLEARIIAVCDAYHAMTTTRSYRRAMPIADALDELRRCAGTQFEPSVVDAALEVLSVAALDALYAGASSPASSSLARR
jgi:hypothetical protein